MYMGIDIGGTKTLVARLNNDGVISASQTFATPQSYAQFLRELAVTVADLSTDDLVAAGVAAPGTIDRKNGIALSFGNLPWRNIPLVRDVRRMLHCPVVLENDANLAGLSEAMLLKQYACILYITISTGIGTGIITDRTIDPRFADSEGGHILLEHHGKLQTWESFASGKAILRRFGKRASDINDQKTWKIISRDIALGLFDLIATIEPDAVVLGGGVSMYFDKFQALLAAELHHYATPLTPIPPILQAARPNEAVVYGCYDLARSVYGKHH